MESLDSYCQHLGSYSKSDGKPPEHFKQSSDIIWIIIGQDGSGPDVEND